MGISECVRRARRGLGGPGAGSVAECFPQAPQAPVRAPTGFMCLLCQGPSSSRRALHKQRVLTCVRCAHPAFRPGCGVQPPAPSFPKEAPLDLQMKSI